ncbi:MAG TPA: serine protease [Labilithrix sp.]|nr:serine protease [Labilithrix sp.]
MRLERIRLALSLVAVMALAPALARADEPVPAAVEPPAAACAPGWESDVFAAARGSVVRITDGDGWGAGFAWKTPRHIVTAMHVVDHARSFEIVFGDGSKGRAHVVAGNRSTDVAILVLDGDPPKLTPLGLGDPASLPLGSPVIAIGHPFARETSDTREEGLRVWTITRGVLGARNDHQIQVDAQLNPGNSGGPILDCTGRVIGVASHIAGTLGFASSPREILALDRSRELPGVSFAPSAARFGFGLSARAAGFTSYGPFVELGVAFFDNVHLLARATGLVSVRSAVDGDRVITSRTGVELYAGAGYGFRLWRVRLVPQVGVASFSWRESATTFANGRANDSSQGLSSVRLTPGLSVASGRLMFDYKMEMDAGAIRDSAHVFSASTTLF